MTDFKKCYTSSAGFSCEFLFNAFYSAIPSKFQYEMADPDFWRDCAQIKFDLIKDLFKQVDVVRIDSWVEAEEDEEERGGSLVIAADHRVIYIHHKGVSIYWDSMNDRIEAVEELAREIFRRIPREEPETSLSKIRLIKYCNGDYYTSSVDVRKVDLDINECYNDDFIPVYNDIVNFLKEPDGGIIILHGAPGTGKSSVIRHLCNTYEGDYIVVPNSVACRLGDPDLIDFITTNRNSTFILEDCEQLLEDRSENAFNNAISTILNMADGLLGDAINIKFICTFNAAIEKIDSAILRKGRCIAKYEFGKLSSDKVAHLNEKYDLHLPEIKEMTLAEVFHAQKADYTESCKRKKIGF